VRPSPGIGEASFRRVPRGGLERFAAFVRRVDRTDAASEEFFLHRRNIPLRSSRAWTTVIAGAEKAAACDAELRAAGIVVRPVQEDDDGPDKADEPPTKRARTDEAPSGVLLQDAGVGRHQAQDDDDAAGGTVTAVCGDAALYNDRKTDRRTDDVQEDADARVDSALTTKGGGSPDVAERTTHAADDRVALPSSGPALQDLVRLVLGRGTLTLFLDGRALLRGDQPTGARHAASSSSEKPPPLSATTMGSPAEPPPCRLPQGGGGLRGGDFSKHHTYAAPSPPFGGDGGLHPYGADPHHPGYRGGPPHSMRPLAHAEVSQ